MSALDDRKIYPNGLIKEKRKIEKIEFSNSSQINNSFSINKDSLYLINNREKQNKINQSKNSVNTNDNESRTQQILNEMGVIYKRSPQRLSRLKR